MSDRFGVPDHAPQHAPDHAAQNPTAQGSWGLGGGAADAGWPPPPEAPAAGGSSGGDYQFTTLGPVRKSVLVAIVLAMVFGPLGIFNVSFLNGVAALFTVVPVARWLGLNVVAALGGSIEPLLPVVIAMWCITVPWAVIGIRRRNKRLGV